jgi:hypothetical protein
MARVVSRKAPPMHDDWALLFIEPLPQHHVSFGAIRDVANEFLLQHK